MNCNLGKKQFSFTLYNIIMDQINPTLVLITFSFIWLIKQLTCHCILEVKTKLLWSFFKKHVLVHLKCSHCVKLSFGIFFLVYCTLSVLQHRNVSIMRPWCTWGPVLLCCLIIFFSWHPLSAVLGLFLCISLLIGN